MLFSTVLGYVLFFKRLRLPLISILISSFCAFSMAEDINAMTDSETFKEGMKSVLPDIESRLDGRGVVNDAMQRYGISDKKMADIRELTLKEFGLFTNVQGYVLVSSSMPDSLIRAYALEAERFGFSIIFRGTEKEDDVFSSFTNMANRFHTGDSRMAVQLDPRLFDVFDVRMVPAIVLTEELSLNLCNELLVGDHEYDGNIYKKKNCAPLKKEKYCKLYGSVFIGWAIKEMQESGCLMSLKFGNVDEYEVAEIENVNEDIWSSLTRETQEEESIYMDVFKENLNDPGFK